MKAFLKALLVTASLLCFSTSISSAQDTTYVPSHEMPEGTQMVFVYLGSYDCGPCHKPELKHAIRRVKVLLDRRAKEAGEAFAAIGVDMGWKVQRGFDFLKETGRFDEVMVGRSWTGSGGSRYIFKDEVVSASKPSILVYERNVEPDGEDIEISKPEYLVSKSGAGTIVEWVESGASLNATGGSSQ
jgi:hypothetical protein